MKFKIEKSFFSLLFTCVLIFSSLGCGNTSEISGQKTSSESTENNPSADSTFSGNSSPEDSGQPAVSTPSPDRITASYTVDTKTDDSDDSHIISDILYGLFLEDINFAADGGLYAELIKNRSFEYGSAASGGNRHGWTISDSKAINFTVADGDKDASGLNAANTHYAIITNTSDTYAGIGNGGYLDGLAVFADQKYNVSFYMKTAAIDSTSSVNGDTSATLSTVRISLRDSKGNVYGESFVSGISNEWHKYETNITATANVNEKLYLYVETLPGTYCLDMVSMMPEDTYAGLPIRKDIGEALEALNPSFLRFPGGCVIEGRSEETMYSWKDSIGNAMEFEINGKLTVGDVAVRPQSEDIWRGNNSHPYYTTYGLGFYEYFLLCEALDCLPVPVLNAGMTCQVQSPKYIVYPTDSDKFKQCVQDALDLVEFCLGDETTRWGKVRIDMGHKEPFPLKYVAIGNEQWQTEYHTHYKLFVKAFEEAAAANPQLFGDIELIVANGTASGSTEGWTYIKRNPDSITTLVDEHYYQTPEWFFANNKRYDKYDRSRQAKVFLGEYAAKSNTLRAALAEASYMTGIERNADIVKMACYAPLFGNSTLNQWTPDMMFFSNDDLLLTANYYVQKMYANNVGTTILSSALEVAEIQSSSEGLSGKVGLGSWMTSVAYDNLKVVNNDTDEVLYEADFSSENTLTDDSWKKHKGKWNLKDGWLVQSNTASPSDTNTGDAIYVGDSSWSNYTMTVDAKILSGAEGFLIPICVKDADNNIFWNIGGWGNTVSCLQIVENDAKSDQVTGTVKNLKLKTDTVYSLKIVVNGDNIKCYLNDLLYVNYTRENPSSLYETASVDANGDILLKLVNPTEYPADIDMHLKNIDWKYHDTAALVTTLSGEYLSDANSFANPDLLIPTESKITVSDDFVHTLPKYSVTIIRILTK